MENEKEQKYFIIWLYISILLHLFAVIIMLTIKPTTSSKDPDPASGNYDGAQVIFVQDEPTIHPIPDEPKQPEMQVATRIQGGASPQQNPADQKEAQQDIPTPALSDEYKKGMQNQTNVEDQGIEGNVNIPEDAQIDLEEQREKQILQPAPQTSQLEQPQVATQNKLKSFIESQEKRIAAAETLKAVIQKETLQSPLLHPNEELPQPEVQKIASKKHRPADLGLENISKVQLSKPTQETTIPKKKISLSDLQKGFSQFLQAGNEQYYSTQGNAEYDDAESLKRASYYRQIGLMYQNAHSMAPNLVSSLQHERPINNSDVVVTIERSGKVSNIQMITSCGIDAIDKHHIRVIESIGNFPPVPKYIETPILITASYGNHSNSRSFIPINIRRK
ncbi:MAG: TonB C-terminal domain-containing protein [Candidatus Dependentiae bacterium]|nr:TonB C-terminal domain-containing protein [Candidatus Dependentiae bacterium]